MLYNEFILNIVLANKLYQFDYKDIYNKQKDIK